MTGNNVSIVSSHLGCKGSTVLRLQVNKRVLPVTKESDLVFFYITVLDVFASATHNFGQTLVNRDERKIISDYS